MADFEENFALQVAFYVGGGVSGTVNWHQAAIRFYVLITLKTVGLQTTANTNISLKIQRLFACTSTLIIASNCWQYCRRS